VSTFRHENVRGLEVAMDDPLRVRGIERVGNLNSKRLLERTTREAGICASAAFNYAESQEKFPPSIFMA
jgi:hypothetical protein